MPKRRTQRTSRAMQWSSSERSPSERAACSISSSWKAGTCGGSRPRCAASRNSSTRSKLRQSTSTEAEGGPSPSAPASARTTCASTNVTSAAAERLPLVPGVAS